MLSTQLDNFVRVVNLTVLFFLEEQCKAKHRAMLESKQKFHRAKTRCLIAKLTFTSEYKDLSHHWLIEAVYCRPLFKDILQRSIEFGASHLMKQKKK